MTETGGADGIIPRQLTDESPELDSLIQTPEEERIFEDLETRQEILARNAAKAESILAAAGADPKTKAFKDQSLVLANQFTDLEVAATMDPVTRIYNRRGFDTRLREEADQAERTGAPYVLASIDLNKLKQINDDKVSGGHPAGDDQLASTARMLSRLTRKSDVVGRLGGDEYGVLLRTDMKGASAWGLRMITLMAAADIPVSIGVAEVNPKNLQQSWKTADQRMYHAKESSRAHGGGRYYDGTVTHLR